MPEEHESAERNRGPPPFLGDVAEWFIAPALKPGAVRSRRPSKSDRLRQFRGRRDRDRWRGRNCGRHTSVLGTDVVNADASECRVHHRSKRPTKFSTAGSSSEPPRPIPLARPCDSVPAPSFSERSLEVRLSVWVRAHACANHAAPTILWSSWCNSSTAPCDGADAGAIPVGLPTVTKPKQSRHYPVTVALAGAGPAVIASFPPSFKRQDASPRSLQSRCESSWRGHFFRRMVKQ